MKTLFSNNLEASGTALHFDLKSFGKKSGKQTDSQKSKSKTRNHNELMAKIRANRDKPAKVLS